MPTLAELEELRTEYFADDLTIEERMTAWTLEQAAYYFENAEEPPEAAAAGVPAAPTSRHHEQPTRTPALRAPLWWSADSTVSVSSCSHTADAHADKISAVELLYDSEGVVANPGEIIAASSSWDFGIRLWRVADHDIGAVFSGPAELLGELREKEQGRWVYDIAWCGLLGGGDGGGSAGPGSRTGGAQQSSQRRLGLVSTQTGGMVGEPDQLIRLWGVARADVPSSPTAPAAVRGRCEMLVNVEGAKGGASERLEDPSKRGFVHHRGVHAVACCGVHMATLSSDALGIWTLDRASGRFAEAARGGSPLRQSATPGGLRWLHGGECLVPLGDYVDGALPIVHVSNGLTAAETLHFKGTANDIVELHEGGAVAAAAGQQQGGEAGTAAPAACLVAANANRAFVYDRRAGPQPIARLALQGIAGLAAAAGGAASGLAMPALLAAVGSEVRVYDVRRLPEDTKAAKLPPALATLTSDGVAANAALARVATMGSVVVAGDHEHGLRVWDIARPGTTSAAAS